MAILTRSKITEELAAGRIRMEPNETIDWRPTEEGGQMGPNSVDLRLSSNLLTYVSFEKKLNSFDGLTERLVRPLDPESDNPTYAITIPSDGIVLYPGIIYLGSTIEYTDTPYHVPVIDGRSSVGRLGIRVHATAGKGDVGFRGQWTLEIDVVQPVRIYPGMKICQVSFETVEGKIEPYDGRYQDQTGPTASRFYEGVK